MISNSNYKHLVTLLYLLALTIFDALAVRPDSLFLSEDVINIELRADLSSILKERTGVAKYHKGVLTYTGSDGKQVSLRVEVTSRGNFRRDPENCDFPPLAINFKRKEVGKTLFDNQDKLKLVTPCHSDRDVIQEYMVYKMYNLVTEKSLESRLVKILYFDTGKDRKLFERYSFFIEDEDHAAKRNSASEITKMVTPFDLDGEVFSKMAFFQYMIGNKDWFVTSRRNIIIMQPDDSSKAPFPVPYDFDFAGFVDADYTKPSGVPDASLSKRRVYKGLCYDGKELDDIISFFMKMRPGFESLISTIKILPRYSQTENIGYLREFYDAIGDRANFRKDLLTECETKTDYNIKD